MDTTVQKEQRLNDPFTNSLRPTSAPALETSSGRTLNSDIIRVVLSYLTKYDILSCLFVNHQWSHLAGIVLYSSDIWVVHGYNRKSPLFSPPPITPPPELSSPASDSIFGNTDRPQSPPSSSSEAIKPTCVPLTTSGMPKREWRRRDPPSFLLPSPMKLELLSHVRTLHYHPKGMLEGIPLHESLSPKINFFPSLDTIVIHSEHTIPEYGGPLLYNLRPRHVIFLGIINTFWQFIFLGRASQTDSIPFVKAFGGNENNTRGSIEKVTVHYFNCLGRDLDQLEYYLEPPAIPSEWPESMTELDLVFLDRDELHLPTSSKRKKSQRPSPIPECWLEECSLVVARLIQSASQGDDKRRRNVKVRVIGLGWNWDHENYLGQTVDDESLSPEPLKGILQGQIRENLQDYALEDGMDKENSKDLADKVEFVSLDSYFDSEERQRFLSFSSDWSY